MKDYLLDTNMISAMLKQNEAVWRNVEEVDFAQKKIFLNTLSYYETKRGLLATQATTKLVRFEEIRQNYEMLGTDDEMVLDKASEIYATLKRQGQLLPDADILIAAIALTHDLILVTADRHFDRVEGLPVVNWLQEKPMDLPSS